MTFEWWNMNNRVSFFKWMQAWMNAIECLGVKNWKIWNQAKNARKKTKNKQKLKKKKIKKPKNRRKRKKIKESEERKIMKKS